MSIGNGTIASLDTFHAPKVNCGTQLLIGYSREPFLDSIPSLSNPSTGFSNVLGLKLGLVASLGEFR